MATLVDDIRTELKNPWVPMPARVVILLKRAAERLEELEGELADAQADYAVLAREVGDLENSIENMTWRFAYA